MFPDLRTVQPSLPTTAAAPLPAIAPTPAQQQALAERYAPILYFHPDEHNFLQNPQTYIDQSTLRQEVDGQVGPHGVTPQPDTEVYGLGDVPAHKLAQVGKGNEDADDPLFLDHQNEVLGDSIRDGDLNNSVNLYQYDAASNTITYHFFYAYNDGPPGLGDVQNHEGDWEKMTVQLDDQFQPTEVRYSAHNGMDVARSWADAPKEDGRPVSYVGQGSHANYPEPGTWATNFQTQPGKFHGIPIPGMAIVNDVASSGGTRFDLAGRPAVDVTAQDYYGGHVFWGERGTLAEVGVGDTTGPTGPSATKGPIVDADGSREPLSGSALIPQFFTHTLPDKIDGGLDATEHFLTDTVPGGLQSGWNAGEHFVTDTVPGALSDGYDASKDFVTDTVPDKAGDAWDATGGKAVDFVKDLPFP
jgi:hypothetical protein